MKYIRYSFIVEVIVDEDSPGAVTEAIEKVQELGATKLTDVRMVDKADDFSEEITKDD
jgi:hypothetical protein